MFLVIQWNHKCNLQVGLFIPLIDYYFLMVLLFVELVVVYY